MVRTTLMILGKLVAVLSGPPLPTTTRATELSGPPPWPEGPLSPRDGRALRIGLAQMNGLPIDKRWTWY